MRSSKRLMSLVLIISLLLPFVASAVLAQETEIKTVFVLGAVASPGEYDYKADMTAKSAIATAGDLLPTGNPKDVVLIKSDGQRSNIDISDGSPAAATRVAVGDTIIVRPLGSSRSADGINASITGAVAQPGTYLLTPGRNDNLSDLFNMAGGAAQNADLVNIRVSSVSGDERSTRNVDGSTAEKRKAIKLRSGDAVFVPETRPDVKKKSNMNDVYQATVILATLLSIFRR